MGEWGYKEVVEHLGRGVELVGVAIIVIGLLYSTWRFVDTLRDAPFETQYTEFRRSLARSILLGLEFLVAGDIISTVAVDPSFYSVGVLAIIVAIRTFLSLELELEIEGRWPWQQPPDDSSSEP
jgi:uncharacterized membrane protein